MYDQKIQDIQELIRKNLEAMQHLDSFKIIEKNMIEDTLSYLQKKLSQYQWLKDLGD